MPVFLGTVLPNPHKYPSIMSNLGPHQSTPLPYEVVESSMGCALGHNGGICHFCSIPTPPEPHPQSRLWTCLSDHKLQCSVLRRVRGCLGEMSGNLLPPHCTCRWGDLGGKPPRHFLRDLAGSITTPVEVWKIELKQAPLPL